MDEYENMKILNKGDKEETTIVNINKGKQIDFRGPGYWEKVKVDADKKKNQAAHQIITANGAKIVFVMPSDGALRPRDLLMRFYKTYGEFPKLSMKVYTRIDDNGFPQIVLEK